LFVGLGHESEIARILLSQALANTASHCAWRGRGIETHFMRRLASESAERRDSHQQVRIVSVRLHRMRARLRESMWLLEAVLLIRRFWFVEGLPPLPCRRSYQGLGGNQSLPPSEGIAGHGQVRQMSPQDTPRTQHPARNVAIAAETPLRISERRRVAPVSAVVWDNEQCSRSAGAGRGRVPLFAASESAETSDRKRDCAAVAR
jgi:hypothetical protein